MPSRLSPFYSQRDYLLCYIYLRLYVRSRALCALVTCNCERSSSVAVGPDFNSSHNMFKSERDSESDRNLPGIMTTGYLLRSTI